MANRVPDTHTGIFTQIPKSIKKVWKTEVLDVKKSEIVPEPFGTEQLSLIASIDLTLKFNDEISKATKILDKQSDIRFDRINTWQESRKQWSAIEKAVTEVVDEIISNTRNRAKDNKADCVHILSDVLTTSNDLEAENYTVDLPPIKFSKTIFDDINGKHKSRRTEEPVQGYATTLLPDDSVSNMTSTDLKKLVKKTLREQGGSNKPKRRNAFVRYAAGG
jgi:hypothetical protein